MIDASSPDFANAPTSSTRPSYGYASLDKSAPPAISIITVLFGAGEQLYATALTILGQSLQQWEWLIVSDQSSVSIARATLAKCGELGSRVRILDTPQQNTVAARNLGVREACTPYIIFVASGDLM